jgi:putative nucleotidyltransferase with HDIG domain
VSTHSTTEADRVSVSFAREARRLVSGERRAELAVGGAFVAVAVALPLIAGVHGRLSVLTAAIYVIALATAQNVTFDVGAGYTVPTPVVYVPLLFAVPVTLVPLLVGVALGLAMVPAVLRGQRPVSRMLTVPTNSWFSVGPAVALATLGVHRPDAGAEVLALALAAQFAGDFIANIVRERLRDGISIRDLTEEMCRIYLIDLALAPLGLMVAFATLHRPWGVLLVLPLCGLLSVFSRERRVRLEALVELNDAYRGTALLLGDVVEADDAYTGRHCKGVVRLSIAVAEELGLDANRRRSVEFAALLHDVGKIAVPKEIINKPGRLTEEEWSIVKLHTIEGQRMLERVGGFMGEVGQVVRSSHERWDGGGYPDGLRGDAIPLEARIVSACDAFDAMTTNRSYRAAMPMDQAIAELLLNAGTQFDPRVVDAMLVVLDPTEQVAPAKPTHSGAAAPQPAPALA